MQSVSLLPVDVTYGPDFERLAHGLRLARDFALFFARCNVPAVRPALVEQLKAAVDRPIVEVIVLPDGDPYVPIAEVAQEAPPEAALFIYGLETLLPSSDDVRAQETLNRMNWRRAAYQRLQRPLVFWLPEYALTLISRGAPDFFDWNSGVFEFEVPEPVRYSLLAELLSIDRAGLGRLEAKGKADRTALLVGLWQEYSGQNDAERLARERVALQLGMLHLHMGNYREARTWLDRAMNLARILGDEAAEAAAWHNLASIELRVGDYKTAREKFQKALAMEQKIGDRIGEATTLHQLGAIYVYTGDYEAARGMLQEALGLRQHIGDRAGEAATWHALATIDAEVGDYKPAEEKFCRALEITEDIGHRALQAGIWHNLASIDAEQGNYAAAKEKFAKSLEINYQIGNLAGQGAAWHNLATIDVRFDNYQMAREEFERSLEVTQEIGDRAGEAATFGQLGFLAARLGRQEAGMRLAAVGGMLLTEIGHADADDVREWVNEQASQLNYDQEQFETMLREVFAAYQADRGRRLIEAAFPDGSGESTVAESD